MLREVALLVESDFMNKVIGLICVAPVQSIVCWLRLIALLHQFLSSLNSLHEPLNRLDRLREYVESGGCDTDKPSTLPTSSGDFDHQMPAGSKPTTRLIRTMLMHLLFAIKSTRHLEQLIEQDDDYKADISRDDWLPIFDRLRCQVDVCGDTLEELRRMFWPDTATGDDVASDKGTDQRDNFVFQSLENATSRTALKAQDVDPEDDVLEDIAVGEDSNDEGEVKPTDDLDDDVASSRYSMLAHFSFSFAYYVAFQS
ncbi:unnamed protein product [Echinostoma caproni]|uniref:RING-type E3 ubiquitin transferase n=1 Tax=Echinostoma caproni TaxID=27848 RepID=A0A183AX65_9TREM|nr:unnamed protein product [Echinostoma caproni]